MKRSLLVISAFLALNAPAIAAETPPVIPVVNTTMDVPAGNYVLDPAHASVNFKVNHLGLSNYTARFTKLKADLQFDPKKPELAQLTAIIDPASIQTNFPKPQPDFDAELHGDKWLDSAKFPQITFKSTKIDVTGANTGKITGDFTMHGVTRPLTLDVTFHGGYKSIPMDPSGDARIGFSAHGMLKRSDFGVGNGVPQPGSTLGVGDDVEIIIEAEFTRPNKK